MRETVWGIVHGDSLICHLSCAGGLTNPAWQGYLKLIKGLLWEALGTLAHGHAGVDRAKVQPHGADARTRELRRRAGGVLVAIGTTRGRCLLT
jgi:hypothetical protein